MENPLTERPTKEAVEPGLYQAVLKSVEVKEVPDKENKGQKAKKLLFIFSDLASGIEIPLWCWPSTGDKSYLMKILIGMVGAIPAHIKGDRMALWNLILSQRNKSFNVMVSRNEQGYSNIDAVSPLKIAAQKLKAPNKSTTHMSVEDTEYVPADEADEELDINV